MSIKPKYFIPDNKIKIKPVPVWERIDPEQFESGYVKPSPEQLTYYNYFKRSFEKSEYVDVGGMRNYIRYFIHELYKEYKSDNNFDKLVLKYSILRKEYPKLSDDTQFIEITTGRQLGIQKYLDHKFPWESYISWEKIHEKLLSNSDDDLRFLLQNKFIGTGNLTSYGINNIDAIVTETIDIIRKYEIEKNKNLHELFFSKNKLYIANEKGIFDPDYYKIFYSTEEKFNQDLKIYNERNFGVPEKNILYPVYIPLIVEFSFVKLLNSFIRDGENILRVKNNLPKIGENWISELDLFNKLKNAFSYLEVISQGRPKWLGLQRFDIYFPKLNIAVEYQGAQHFQEVSIFGGKEGFEKTLENDNKKRKLCIENNCTLIEVLPNYNFNDIVSQIQNLINKKIDN